MIEMVNTRAYYRLVFPRGVRPWLQVGNDIYPVVDCSEKGMRIEAEEARRPEIASVLEGKVRFPNGEELEVVGTVLRHTPDGAALSLAYRGIDFGTMLRLQVYLRQRFWLAEEDPEDGSTLPPLAGPDR